MDLLSHFDSLEFHNEESSSPPEEFHCLIEDILSGLHLQIFFWLGVCRLAGHCNLILYWCYAEAHGANCRNSHYCLLSRCCDLLLFYHNADFVVHWAIHFQFGFLLEINEQMSIDFFPPQCSCMPCLYLTTRTLQPNDYLK